EYWRRYGKAKQSLVARLDYFHQLSAQLPEATLRVLYTASGTRSAAAILAGPGVVEHQVYWAPSASIDEARYLEAIFNCETARARVADLQARGQWGARHFDKLMLRLPIPQFDPLNPLHCELVGGAQRAEEVAAGVLLPSRLNFIRARQMI